MVGDSGRLRVGDTSQQRKIKRRLVKQSAKQLLLPFPLQQLRFSLKSVAGFPLSRNHEKNEEEVSQCWNLLTHRRKLLESWTAGPIFKSNQGNGFIYFYHLGDRLCYIGQTRRQGFFQRWSQKFDSGIQGYPYDIKRCLLNAAWRGILRIQTHELSEHLLDGAEIRLIRKHGFLSPLWNQRHNPYFKDDNFNV